MKYNDTIVLRSGVVMLVIGLLRLLNERLGIPRQQMRDSFVRALPYLRPVLLIVLGSTLIVLHINRDDTGK